MPELPNDHIFSPSQLSMYSDCAQSWEFAYVRGLKRKGSKTFFDLGNYFHELSHVYYQLLQQGRRAGDSFTIDYIENRIRRDAKTATSDNIVIINQVRKMMIDFIKRQSPRIDRGIEVLGVELHLEVSFITPKGRTITLQGYLDLLFKDSAGKLRIRDHKTGARKSWNNRQLELLPQLLIYLIMVHEATEWKPYDVEISYINSYEYKKKVPTAEEMFELYRHSHNVVAVDKYREHLLRLIDKIIDEETIHNYSKDCASCQYQQICALELKGIDPKHIISQQFEKVERSYGEINSITAAKDRAEDSSENSAGDNPRAEGHPFVLKWGGTRIGG